MTRNARVYSLTLVFLLCWKHGSTQYGSWIAPAIAWRLGRPHCDRWIKHGGIAEPREKPRAVD